MSSEPPKKKPRKEEKLTHAKAKRKLSDMSTRTTPAEEVAATLGREILTADTDLEQADLAEFTPQARLIIVLGKR